MKRTLLICCILPTFFLSCSEETSEKEVKSKEFKSTEELNARDYNHIITESTSDYPTTLRSAKNLLLNGRMILEITLDSSGGFNIEGKPGNWEMLKVEVDLFFDANRELGTSQTKAAIKNEDYRYNDYPFYSYFTKRSYNNFIKQLSEMAESDMSAALYLQRHSRRIKSFDAVEDREIGFINPLAMIRYSGDSTISEELFAELEKHLAQYIYELRSELAYDKFNTNYEMIRRKAQTDKAARLQLLYLQEMYPAYLMRVTGNIQDQIESIPPPPMPIPPPTEEIIELENKPEMPSN